MTGEHMKKYQEHLNTLAKCWLIIDKQDAEITRLTILAQNSIDNGDRCMEELVIAITKAVELFAQNTVLQNRVQELTDLICEAAPLAWVGSTKQYDSAVEWDKKAKQLLEKLV